MIEGKRKGSIARPGQGGLFAVDGRYPAGNGLNPLAVIHAAHVSLVHKGTGGEAGSGVAVDIGLFHLREASGGLTKDKHDLGNALVGGQPQGHGGSRQGVVLVRTQVVGQRLVLAAVDAVHDLIVAGVVVGAGHNLIQNDLGGQRVPPIEAVQPDIGGIGDPGEHIAHRLAAHDLLGAGLGDGNAGGQGLVRDLKGEDLSLMLQISVEDGIIHAVVVRGLDLLDGVAAQREGLGNRQSPAVALDGVHHIVGLIVNLKDRAGQKRTLRQTVGGVVVGGLLDDLDLRGDGGILPLHQSSLPSGHIDRFHLRIHDIPLILQFPEIVPPGGGQPLNVDVAAVVAGVLADGGIAGIIQKEGNAINSLAGRTVGLMNQNPAERLVFHRQRGGFAVLHCKIMMGGVQLEALRRLNFKGVVAASVQVDMDTAILAGCDSLHQSAVHLPDLKGSAGDAPGGVALGNLDKLQPALALIEEGEGLSNAALDKDGLRRGVQHIAADSLDLLGGDGGAGNQIGEDNSAIAVCHILAVVRPYHLPGAVSDEEGHALDGVGGAVHILLDGEGLLGGIVEGEGLRVLGVDLHRLRLGRRVDGVALNGAGFLHHDGAGHAGNVNLAVGVGDIQTVGGQVPVGVVHIPAPGVGQLKFHTGQRFAGGLVQLADDKLPGPLVPEGEGGSALTRFDLHGFRGAVQHEALHRLDLLGGDGAAGFQPLNDDLALGIGVEGAIAGADRGAIPIHHFEAHTGQRLVGGALNVLMNGQGLLRVILKSQVVAIAGAAAGGSARIGHGAGAARQGVRAIFHDNGFGLSVQHIAAGHADLGNHHSASGDEAGNGGGAILPGSAAGQHVPISILHHKRGIGHRLTRDGIQLGDGQGGQRFIEEGKRLRVLRVDGDGLCLRTGIHDVAGGRFEFLGDNGAHQAGNADFSLIISGIEAVAGQMPVVSVHKSTVGVGKLELRAGNQRAAHAVLLQNDQRSGLPVGEGKGLDLALLDLDGLGGAVQDVALHGLNLAGGDGAAGGEVIDGDAPVGIGDILAVAGADRGPVIVRHQELDAFQRLVVGASNKLLDHQRCAGGIVERQLLRIVGVHHNRLAAAGLVNHIAGESLYLRDHQRPHHAGNLDLAVGVGVIEAVGGGPAALIRHKLASGGSDLEGNAFQRLIGQGILLLDQQGSGAGVLYNNGLRVSAAPNDHIGGRGVDHIAVRGLDLVQHIGAGGQVGNADFPLRVRGKNTVLGQRRRADHAVQTDLTACGSRHAELGPT